MTFDFTNYTFSFFISLLSAILGIGYPLILDNIRKIDDCYNSTRFSERLLRERCYRFYVIFLVITIIYSFVSPFIMHYFNTTTKCDLVLVIHAFFMLSLVYYALRLFNVISIYINPKLLETRIQTPPIDPPNKGGDSPNGPTDGGGNPISPNGGEDLFCLVDLANYASKNANFELFNNCISKIQKYGYAERQATILNKEYNVSPLLRQVFRQIIQNSNDTNSIYFYNSNFISLFFYNSLEEDYILGEDTMKLIWYNLFNIISRDNYDNFISYWNTTNQYCTFKLDYYKTNYNNESSYYKFHERFHEFHYMVGALLVNSKNSKMIKHMLFFSNSLPAKYPLIPSSLSSIIDALANIENNNLKNPFLYSCYKMPGIDYGALTDYTIKELVYQYFALLTIRLASVNDWNITYSNPMDIPSVDTNMKNHLIKWHIGLINKLLTTIDYWYKEENFHLLRKFGLSIIPENKSETFTAQKNLYKYKNDLANLLKEHTENSIIDEGKIEDLKCKLEKVPMKLHIPMSEEKKKESLSVPIVLQTAVDSCNFSPYENYNWSNFPEVFIEMLSRKIENYYIRSIFNCTRILFEIPENHLFDFLDDLKLTEKYDILSGIDFCHIGYMQKKEEEITNKKGEIYYRNSKVWNLYDLDRLILIKQSNKALLSFDADEENLEYMNLNYDRLPNSDLYFCKGEMTEDKMIPISILKKVTINNLPLGGFVEIKITEKTRYPYERVNKTIDTILGH